jgi:hypothetical protein
MTFDMHNAHAERQSKETIKAMDIASRLATHPESQPVVNSELDGLSHFMAPANTTAPTMADGGEVDESDDGPPEIDLQALLADITAKLRRPEYMN